MNKNILVVIFVIFLAGCTVIPADKTACTTANVEQTSKQFNSLVVKWSDMLKLTNETPRAYVINPIIELQHIKWDVDDLEVPTCLSTAKGDLTQSMSLAIDGMALFMGQSSDTDVSAKIDESNTQFSNFTTELNRIQTCAPKCDKK